MPLLDAVPYPVSPLVLADRLISLAQEAERAGLRMEASRLMVAMMDVLDPPRDAQTLQ